MILVILFIFALICFIIGHLIEERSSSSVEMVFHIAGAAAAIGLIIICIVAATAHLAATGTVERNKEIYNSLVYKMESTTCRDEFGFLNKEVIDEVTEWNKDVRYYQSVQDNFWIGIMYPNVFDQFETIEYDRFISKEAG